MVGALQSPAKINPYKASPFKHQHRVIFRIVAAGMRYPPHMMDLVNQ
jgi:hypothetical protein